MASTCHQSFSWRHLRRLSVETLTDLANRLKMGCSRSILLSLGLVAIAATVASQENWMSFYTRFVLYSCTCAGYANFTKAQYTRTLDTLEHDTFILIVDSGRKIARMLLTKVTMATEGPSRT